MGINIPQRLKTTAKIFNASLSLDEIKSNKEDYASCSVKKSLKSSHRIIGISLGVPGEVSMSAAFPHEFSHNSNCCFEIKFLLSCSVKIVFWCSWVGFPTSSIKRLVILGRFPPPSSLFPFQTSPKLFFWCFFFLLDITAFFFSRGNF